MLALRKFKQWAGSDLRLNSADPHVILDLVCDEETERDRLQAEIVKQFDFVPAFGHIRWNYVPYRSQVILEHTSSSVCSLLSSTMPLVAPLSANTNSTAHTPLGVSPFH